MPSMFVCENEPIMDLLFKERKFDYELMEGDHITPWRDGGRTVIENCQMLCRECNRRKGAR